MHRGWLSGPAAALFVGLGILTGLLGAAALEDREATAEGSGRRYEMTVIPIEPVSDERASGYVFRMDTHTGDVQIHLWATTVGKAQNWSDWVPFPPRKRERK